MINPLNLRAAYGLAKIQEEYLLVPVRLINPYLKRVPPNLVIPLTPGIITWIDQLVGLKVESLAIEFSLLA